jgi:hypothetical protein
MAEENFLLLFNSWVPRKAGKSRHSQICEKSGNPWTLLCSINTVTVRYHCEGWPEEVNTCFLNSYMVYL